MPIGRRKARFCKKRSGSTKVMAEIAILKRDVPPLLAGHVFAVQSNGFSWPEAWMTDMWIWKLPGVAVDTACILTTRPLPSLPAIGEDPKPQLWRYWRVHNAAKGRTFRWC